MRYKLSPYFRTGIYNNKILLCGGSIKQTFNIDQYSECLLNIINEWIELKSVNEINSTIINLNKYSLADINTAINFLIKSQFLINEENLLFIKNNDRYSRQLLFYHMYSHDIEKIHNNIKNATIAIIGCGGIGNIIGCHLVCSGVKNIILLDNDKIELSNLTRQYMFNESHIGSYKTHILKEELMKRNNTAQINIINEFATQSSLNKLPKCDFMIVSADTPDNLIFLINDYSINNNIPFLNVGYVDDYPCFGPMVIPQKTACIECKTFLVNNEHNNENIALLLDNINKRHKYQVGSNGQINAISASYAALDVFKYLGKFSKPLSLNKRIATLTNKCEFETQNFQRNKSCKKCSNI